MPPIGRGNKNTFFGNTQQFPQQSDLTLKTQKIFEQIVTGDPVNRFIVKRELDVFLNRLSVGCIDLETTMGIFSGIGLLTTTKGSKGFINALLCSLTCGLYHF
jgi:hypothetical protein